MRFQIVKEFVPRRVAKDNNRIALRVQAADKAVILRAVAVAQTDMTEFILRAALREAHSVIEENASRSDVCNNLPPTRTRS